MDLNLFNEFQIFVINSLIEAQTIPSLVNWKLI